MKLLCCTLIVIFLYSLPLAARVKKKVHSDGTVEYYNLKKRKKKVYSGDKFDFKSSYMPLIEKISREEGVDPYLIKCVIKVESNFKANAVSVAGAMGLMQIMQHIARHYKLKDPLNPTENLTAGIKHLKSLLNYFKNNVPLAVAAYHAGLGRVRKRMKVPPIKSTIKYVNRVMYFYSRGKKEAYVKTIKKLYKRISKDGTIVIHD